MRTPSLITCAVLAAIRVYAQNPTAYIPASPSHSISAPACTPPPGATCVPANTSSTTTHFFPAFAPSYRAPPSAATQVPSLLSSLQSSWSQQPSYTLLASALYSIAPSSAQSSLAIQGQFTGWNWETIINQPWYTTLPQVYQGMVNEEKAVLEKAFDDYVGANKVSAAAGRGVDGVVMAWAVGAVVGIGVLGVL